MDGDRGISSYGDNDLDPMGRGVVVVDDGDADCGGADDTVGNGHARGHGDDVDDDNATLGAKKGDGKSDNVADVDAAHTTTEAREGGGSGDDVASVDATARAPAVRGHVGREAHDGLRCKEAFAELSATGPGGESACKAIEIILSVLGNGAILGSPHIEVCVCAWTLKEGLGTLKPTHGILRHI